jgi:hypothetical protein
MGLSMSDKEVFLGIEVSGRSMLDRWVEKAAPVLGKVAPAAVQAELSALASEVGHLDELVAGSGLDAVPATGDDVAWLMHRSCSLGLPAPRTIAPTNSSRWEAEDLATFTDGVDMFQEPYAPTVRVVGRLRSATVQRNVAVLTVGLMDSLRIPEVDDPWMQHSDRLPFPVEWSARVYVRRPEEVTGELQRQMGKVRSQIRHYTHDHDLDPPMSLARQADRVLEVEDELTSGLTQLNTRLYGWWRVAVSGRTRPRRSRAPSRCSRSTGRRCRSSTPRRSTATPRVHPRRAAGVDGLPAPRLGDVGGGRRARRHGQRGRPPRHHAGGDLHGDAAPGGVGPVARPGGPARVRAHRGRRRPGFGQVVPHRADRLQDAARGCPAGRCSTRPGRWRT